MNAPAKNPLISSDDITLAVFVLETDQDFRTSAANSYRRHPAKDDFDVQFNEDRARAAERAAESLGRIIEFLNGVTSC